ncbi:MAG TPA: hypothetical protein PKH37_03740 [Alphaproteobacteria bacterium]|nr:hypothetical protein [Alphaproteobacteria bacterium]
MIDRDFRAAVRRFYEIGDVTLAAISPDFVREKLPKDPVEALAVFRCESYKSKLEMLRLAIERGYISYNILRLGHFMTDLCDLPPSYLENYEFVARRYLAESRDFAVAALPVIYNFSQKGIIVGGHVMPSVSEYETMVRTELHSSVAKLQNSLCDLGSLVDIFNSRASLGSPVFSPEERPDESSDPNVILSFAWAELASNFGGCIDVEEKRMRNSMAQYNYVTTLASRLGVDMSRDDDGRVEAELAQNQAFVHASMERVDRYYSVGLSATAYLSKCCLG